MSADEPAHILLVEDDAKLAALVKRYLEQEGFAVTVEPRGDRAVARIVELLPSLVLLDVMLPGADGFTVCREARSRFAGPIAMLTAKTEEVDEVLGLEFGADDYIAKPVRPRVLLARIRMLLRRAEALTSGLIRRLTIGDLCVDASRREVTRGNVTLELTTLEFDLLWLLASHAGQVLSRDRLYAELHGTQYDGLDRSIDLCVSRLRRKLGDPRWIKSVRGTGYLLAGAP